MKKIIIFQINYRYWEYSVNCSTGVCTSFTVAKHAKHGVRRNQILTTRTGFPLNYFKYMYINKSFTLSFSHNGLPRIHTILSVYKSHLLDVLSTLRRPTAKISIQIQRV